MSTAPTPAPRRSRWTHPPRLRTLEPETWSRHATWLELFFDLVFVVCIAALASLLAHDLSVVGFLRFVGLFVPVWWVWSGFTFYADRFDTDDVVHRALVVLGMMAVIALAVTIPGTFEGASAEFALAYFAVRVTLIALYVRAWLSVPQARGLIESYLVFFGSSALLWLVSAFVPEPTRFVLWGVAVLVQMLLPWLRRELMERIPVSVSHIPERIGLFTIIVLGESVVAVVVGTSETVWEARSVITAVAGFLAVVALWWTYFESVDHAAIGRGIRSGLTYVYGHIPLLIGLTTMAVGIELSIEESHQEHLSTAAAWALCGGAAIFLVSVVVIHLATRDSARQWKESRRAAGAVAAIVLAATSELVPPVVVALLLTGVLIAVTAIDVVDEARPAVEHDRP